MQHDVVDAPVVAQGGEPSLCHDRDDRHRDTGRAHQSGQCARVGEVAPGVDEDRVDGRQVQQRVRLGPHHPYRMREQAQGGQHLGRRRKGVREQQQPAHLASLGRSPRRAISGGRTYPRTRSG